MNERDGDKNYHGTANSAIFSVTIGGSVLTNPASECIIRYKLQRSSGRGNLFGNNCCD